MKPRPRKGPVALRRTLGHAQDLGHLDKRQACKTVELDQFSEQGVFACELAKGFVQSDQVIWAYISVIRQVGQFHSVDSLVVAPALSTLLSPGIVHQDTPHRLSGGAEEMSAASPTVGFVSHQSDVGLVDEGRCLKCLPGRLMRQLLRSKKAEFLVDQR